MTYLVKPATWLAGYIPDLPTPFDEDDRLDLAAFAKLCERQIEAGVRAIVVGETAGEAATPVKRPPGQSSPGATTGSSWRRPIGFGASPVRP